MTRKKPRQTEVDENIDAFGGQGVHAGAVVRGAVDAVHSDCVKAQRDKVRDVALAGRRICERVRVSRRLSEAAVCGVLSCAGGDACLRLIPEQSEASPGQRTHATALITKRLPSATKKRP